MCHHQKLGFKSNDWWLFFAKYNYRVYTAIIFLLTPCTSPFIYGIIVKSVCDQSHAEIRTNILCYG